MPLIVNSNIGSLKGINSVRQSSNRIAKTLEHISSGIRVNKAADDAGRIGSITLAESQVRGLQKSIQNLNDGLSLAQTLEGSLGQVELIMQRMRQLAVQAATDTYSYNDRKTLQEEVKQLLGQVDTIVEQTNFNKIRLLDGSADHVGIFVDDGLRTESFDLKLHDVRESSVGRKAQYESQRRGVHVSDLADGDIIINDFKVRATNDSDDTLSYSFGSGSAIAKAKAINAISHLTGVTARAGQTHVIANRQIGAFTLTQSQYFSINGANIGGFAITDFDADGSLRQAINEHVEETGVVASLTSQGELQLVAKDGRNIQIQYSHKNVLEAVGLADTTLDPNNQAGHVIKGDPDRDLHGTIQNITTSGGFTGGLIEVGGRFDGSEASKDNYVDFVGHVVKSGGIGVAEIRWERDVGGDVSDVEDFDFIEGSVNAAPNLGSVTGSFFVDGGVITAGGSYNEGLNREYYLTVTQAGSTDGADLTKRAVVQVSTAEDGIIVNSLTLDANAGPQLIATSTTGEDVFIDIGESVRSTALNESNTFQEYEGVIGNGVTIGGIYTGDVSKDFTVRVINEGYTQGGNQAKVEVFEKNYVTDATISLGSFVVNAGVPINLNDGLTITFDPETPSFGTFTDNGNGSYAGAVNVVSAPGDFEGERGDGTYGVLIKTAGPTGLATYVTTFNGAEITAAQTLQAGDNVLADGLTFNFGASVPVIGATNVTAPQADYANVNGVFIGGAYDGQLNDFDLHVRVKTEGRVLADNAGAGEPETDDGAIIEFSLDGGATWQGDILVVADRDLALSNGLTIRFAGESAISEFKSLVDGSDLNDNHTFTTGSIAGYEGDIRFNLDHSLLDIGQDATISIEVLAEAKIGTSGPGSGNILIHVTESDGSVQTTTLSNVQSGNPNDVIPGLQVIFTNDPTTIEKSSLHPGGVDGAGGNDVDMDPDGNYNGNLGDSTFRVTFTGDTTVEAPVLTANGLGNDGVTAGTVGPYNGAFNDTTYKLTFNGTSSTLSAGAGNDDIGKMTISGDYSGSEGDATVNVTCVASSTENTVSDAAGGGNFDVRTTGNFSRLSNSETLTVSFDAKTVAGTIASATVSSAATATLSATTFNWDAGTHNIKVLFVADDEVKVDLDGVTSATISGAALNSIDLVTLFGAPAFNGVNHGLTLNVTTDAILDETGDILNLKMESLQTASIVRQGGGGQVLGLTLTGATSSFNLSDARFVADLGIDLGIGLEIDQASQADSNGFTVNLAAVMEADIVLNGDVPNKQRVDISSGSVSLNGLPNFTGNSDITLHFDNPLKSIDDSYDIQLNMAKTGTLTQDGLTIDPNVDITTGNIDLVGSGVTLTLTNVTQAIDDSFTVNLNIDKTVRVELDTGNTGVFVDQGVFSVAGGSLDLTAALGTNVGFDLTVDNPEEGRDDEFTFALTTNHELSAIAATDLLGIEQRTIKAGDLFTADVDAGTLEANSEFTLEVDAPTLELGKEYVVQERVGTLKVGDIIKVQANHDFANGPQVLQTTTQLSNGLTLELNPGANFTIGDEIRFQALQYQGDPSCSGPYDDPAFPTTFVVEVTKSGAVDGGAEVTYTRLDNGDSGTIAASTIDTLLQNNVHIGFSAGTLYEGDIFFVETVSDLAQDFGGELILESAKGIEIQLASVTIDNELGRLLYVGDPELAQLAGTFDSLTNAYLGVNAEETIGEIDISTKEGANNALRILDLALDEISAFRSDTGAVQNRIEKQVNSLSEALYQTESYVSRIRDADLAFETAQLAQDQIIQLAGVQILAQMNINPQIALRLVESL